jgi:hypothetical protein
MNLLSGIFIFLAGLGVIMWAIGIGIIAVLFGNFIKGLF